MSKHFELMQQLEKDQSFSSEPVGTSVLSSQTKRSSEGRWANEESLRLVQQVFLLRAQEPPHVVVFAGIEHGNGCSQIAASVAETLAKNSRRPVCLVEANFRSPRLPEMYGMTNHHGLTNALLEAGPISAYVKEVAHDNLWMLSSGTLAADSASLLNSDNLRGRLIELRQEFGFVIIDAPPLTRYSDAIVLGQLSDGLVLVIEADSTRREAASVATKTLQSSQVSILAAVLNKRSFPIPQKIYEWL
jgi:capsular exopolysaccharide synthesis family protein